MRQLVWDNSFRRAFKGRTRNDQGLQERIFDTLDELVGAPFQPKLKTHKLKGRLDGMKSIEEVHVLAMTDIAIRVDHLSKLYPARSLAIWRPGMGWAGHLGALYRRADTSSADLSTGLRDALTGMFCRGHQSTNPQSTNPDDLWALREVSFEIQARRGGGHHRPQRSGEIKLHCQQVLHGHPFR